MSSVAIDMRLLHRRSVVQLFSCSVVHELHFFHELRRRAHGSVQNEFTINHELASSLFMSFIVVHELLAVQLWLCSR